MKVLTTIDLLALPSLETPPAGHVGFGAKSDGLYQKVGTVETKLAIDGHTHTIAQITGLQGALDSKATPADISTAVNNLEIGGRNLLLNTKNERSGTYNVSPAYILTEKPIEGESYTLSGWFKFPEGKLKRIMAYNSGGIVGLFTWTNNEWPYDEWFYFSRTFTWRTSTANDTSVFIYGGASDGLLSYAKLIKLEKGNKATDWTPAPEDQVSDWSESNASSFSFIKNKPTLLSQFTDNIGVASHIANKANPHNVTTAQIGAVDLTTNQTIGGNKTFTGNVTAPTFIGALSGNASSATKLQTARTIWGQSFDGTANVSGALTSVTDITASGTVQGLYGKFTNLSANYLPKQSSSGLVNSLIYDNGTNVGINNLSPVTNLMVTGTGSYYGSVQISGTRGQGDFNLIQANNHADFVIGNNLRIVNDNGHNLEIGGNHPSISGSAITFGGNVATNNFIGTNVVSIYSFSPSSVSSGAAVPITPTAVFKYGSVGIGTISPFYKLDVNGTGRFTSSLTAQSLALSGAISGATTIAASTSVTTPKHDLGNGWAMVASGSEMQMQYNGVTKMRFLSDGSFVAVGEVTAYVAAT